MKLYQYPKCSTCRKATKFLNENKLTVESLDITETPPSTEELRAMLDSYDGNIRKLFNTSGLQYRELGMKDKIASMSDAEAIELLAGNGKLIKRPFLLNSTHEGVVGFTEETWRKFLKL